MGAGLIARETHQDEHRGTGQAEAGLTLLFPAGGRPSAEDVEMLLAGAVERADRVGSRALKPVDRQPGDRQPVDRQPIAAQISSRRGRGEGWLEILASGLTFDLVGLDPGEAQSAPAARHYFGLSRDADSFAFEAIVISPGPHLAGAGAMVPVVRTMAVLASALAAETGALAVCWPPAGSWMDVSYFSRIVESWGKGGAFPALGLTGIERTQDGGVESDGLAYFIGQELRVESRKGEAAADTVKLAARVIDHLVNHGAISGREALVGPTGEALLAEPSADRRFVQVWRDG